MLEREAWDGGRFVIGNGEVCFTTRMGGTSVEPWDSLNLGTHVGDRSDSVELNRALLVESLGLEALVGMEQVHGSTVEIVEHGWTGSAPQADSLVTSSGGLGLLAVTADCVPIGLGSDTAVAVVHAGWRGLVAGVVERAVEVLRGLCGTPIDAALGPCAGACCYEVSTDVAVQLGESAVGTEQRVDLHAITARRLELAGASLVGSVSACTICDPERRFFSHRAHGPVTGRQGALAWLNS